MKNVFLVLVLTILSFGVHAKLIVCDSPYGGRGVLEKTDNCTDLMYPVKFDTVYSSSEIDKKFNAHQERIFNIEQALQQETVIPESTKEELKKQIIEELKKEFILTPKN